MAIAYQLFQFYLLTCIRNQQSFFEIILKSSTSIVRSAVPFVSRLFYAETSPAFYGVGLLIGFYMERAFTKKFRRQTNRFLQVSLYLLLLIFIADSYFVLFKRLYLRAKNCPHLKGKILLNIGNDEIAVCTNIFAITLQLPLFVFFPIGNSFIFKDAV